MISRKRSSTFEVMIDRRKQVVSSMYYIIFKSGRLSLDGPTSVQGVLYRLPKRYQDDGIGHRNMKGHIGMKA